MIQDVVLCNQPVSKIQIKGTVGRCLSRVSIVTRDIDAGIMSVCLSSVRDVPVLDESGLTYCHSFFLPYGSPIILVLSASVGVI